ncbi:MAG: tpiA [Candidatus Saccharibacteria bacterium]|jgi:triosephosphate isomerase|nr:tpiA [Candidatus Saccharibacteria bacterium]
MSLIVGNWKMNLNPHDASVLVHRLNEKIEAKEGTEIVLCAPFIDLYPLSKEINHKKFKLGAQNLHPNDHGAFTGEISGAMLKGLVQYSLVGHSERRAMGETDVFIAKKVAAALRNDITPVLCVGELLDDRHHNLTKKVIVDQLTTNLSQLTAEDISKIVIAYEPVWAIGAGTPATPEQIAPQIRTIRSTVEELYGEEAANVRVIYGASVAGEFVKTIMNIEGVEGLLPGGASLNYEEFAKIVSAVQELD